MRHKLTESNVRLRGMATLAAMAAATWLAGIFFFRLPIPVREEMIAANPEQASSVLDQPVLFLVTLFVALGVMYLVRKKRFMGEAVAVLLGLLIFNALVLFIEPLVAALLAVLIVYVERAYRSFLTTDLFVLLGIFAGTMPIAAAYRSDILAALLMFVSVYDIIGVKILKAIPKIALSAAEQGMPLLLLSPKAPARWLDRPALATCSSLMGAGDVFVPLLFITSVSIQYGTIAGLCVFGGAILGNVVNIHFALKAKRGIPAMPLLALGMLLVYAFFR